MQFVSSYFQTKSKRANFSQVYKCDERGVSSGQVDMLVDRSDRSEMFVARREFREPAPLGAAYRFRSAGARSFFVLCYKHSAPSGARNSCRHHKLSRTYCRLDDQKSTGQLDQKSTGRTDRKFHLIRSLITNGRGSSSTPPSSLSKPS